MKSTILTKKEKMIESFEGFNSYITLIEFIVENFQGVTLDGRVLYIPKLLSGVTINFSFNEPKVYITVGSFIKGDGNKAVDDYNYNLSLNGFRYFDLSAVEHILLNMKHLNDVMGRYEG